ncbi:hypothetical protein DRO29_05720 [Candidatus Bathyarchaeota archaeon]|nr:MAG: hypothetical protein DRO29_05720 [Candidatus Bathyarchaeota archaeon]
MDSGVIIIDVSDPSSPVKIGEYKPPSYLSHVSGISLLDSCLYVAYGADSLAILDVSDPSSPAVISYYTDNNTFLINDVFAYQNYAYLLVFTWSFNEAVKVIDISDPSSPLLAGYYEGLPYGGANVFVYDYRAYVACGEAGFQTYGEYLEVVGRKRKAERFCIFGVGSVISLSFSLSHATRVVVELYDVAGRKAETLLDKYMEAGRHRMEWNLSIPSGIYFVKLSLGGVTSTKKVIMIK